MPVRDYREAYHEHVSVAPMSEFVEQVGLFFDRFGFRRNLGRIWVAAAATTPGE